MDCYSSWSLAELVGSLRLIHMKCEVKLFKAGTVFTEEVIADYQDARVALARNPGAKLLELLLYSNEQTCIAFVTS